MSSHQLTTAERGGVLLSALAAAAASVREEVQLQTSSLSLSQQLSAVLSHQLRLRERFSLSLHSMGTTVHTMLAFRIIKAPGLQLETEDNDNQPGEQSMCLLSGVDRKSSFIVNSPRGRGRLVPQPQDFHPSKTVVVPGGDVHSVDSGEVETVTASVLPVHRPWVCLHHIHYKAFQLLWTPEPIAR